MNVSPEIWALVGAIAAFVLSKAWDILFLSFKNAQEKDLKQKSKEGDMIVENMIAVTKVESSLEKLSEHLLKFDFKLDSVLNKMEKYESRLTKLEVLLDRSNGST